MHRLNILLSLHERTKLKHQKHGRRGLAARMFSRFFEIERIGKQYDDIERNDISTEHLLISYLARNIYINEKYLRGEFLFDSDYELEKEFSDGLWRLFTVETMNEFIPAPAFPNTYDDYEKILKSKDTHVKNYSIYKVANEIVMFNNIRSLDYCSSFEDFDLHCCLPSGYWTVPQNNASKSDKRNDAPQRIIQTVLGLYIFDSKKCDEPHYGFWLNNAKNGILKALALYEKKFIIKFRNATMIDLGRSHDNYVLVENFRWNIPRNKKAY